MRTMPMLDPDREDDAHTAKRLATETIAWLSTTTAGGRPHSVPVWFAWVDPVAVVCSSPTTRKVGNLRRNPACVLALESADAGNDVVFVEANGSPASSDDEAVRRCLDVFAGKYAPLLDETSFDDWRLIFSQPLLLEAVRVVAWCKPGGKLRYRAVS